MKIIVTILAILLFWTSSVSGDIREVRNPIEEGNDGYATWSYVNQFGDTTAPDSACFYIYDEKTQTVQFSVCTDTPDDIQQYAFTPCGTQILDPDNSSEAKLFSTIWTYPVGAPVLTGTRTYRVWVTNSRSLKVTGSFPGTCTVTPE